MKNTLALVLALTVISAPAFASRARLESLGEGKNGSYYIDDSRNMFLNPAHLVHYKKKLFLELGTDTVGALDSVAGSRAQGGFTNTFGDFTYGLYLNQTSERTLGAIAQANAVVGNFGLNTFVQPDSTLEFFLAGESGLNWGISLFYAGNDQKTAALEKTASQLGVRLGVDVNNLQVFTTLGLLTKSTVLDGTPGGNTELKGKIGVDAGVTYKMNDATAFAKFVSIGSDLNSGGTTLVQGRLQQYGLGLGFKKEMTKSTNMYARIEGDYLKTSPSASGDNKTYAIPLVLAAEAQALSWLAVRGSIEERLLGQTWNATARNSLAGTTTVSAGLGLTFGDVQIDGLVATNGASTAANTVPGFGTAPQTNTNFGFGDNMLTRLAMTYNF